MDSIRSIRGRNDICKCTAERFIWTASYRARAHIDNNEAVRQMMLGRGIVPEALPAGEDVKKVERRLKLEEKKIGKKN